MALLRNGSRGEEVTELQQMLEDAGFSPGNIDGVFGPKTEAALRSYQAANDLSVDGVAGPETMASFGMAADPEAEDAAAGEGPRMSIPGGAELWKVGEEDWLVYIVPDTQPPIYMGWLSPSDEDTQSFFGPGQPIVYDNTLGSGMGAIIDFGSTDELANMDDNPFAAWTQTLETQAKTQPWILDDDYQALIAMATLEGRKLTESEIQTTNWWQSNSAGQREWMKLYHGDPMEAANRSEDNRALARSNLVDAGVTGITDEMVNFMADKVTSGDWTETYFQTQVNAVADGASIYDLDPELQQFAGMGQTIEHEDTVQDLANKWLGPAYSQWGAGEIEKWAGELRNDPNGQQRLEEHLKNQRLALFPEYEDRNLSYEDIAAPWRNYATNIWGQAPDETDNFFMQLIRNNDANMNGQILRREGMERNIGKVMVDASSAVLEGAGTSVRRPVG